MCLSLFSWFWYRNTIVNGLYVMFFHFKFTLSYILRQYIIFMNNRISSIVCFNFFSWVLLLPNNLMNFEKYRGWIMKPDFNRRIRLDSLSRMLNMNDTYSNISLRAKWIASKYSKNSQIESKFLPNFVHVGCFCCKGPKIHSRRF